MLPLLAIYFSASDVFFDSSHLHVVLVVISGTLHYEAEQKTIILMWFREFYVLSVISAFEDAYFVAFNLLFMLVLSYRIIWLLFSMLKSIIP